MEKSSKPEGMSWKRGGRAYYISARLTHDINASPLLILTFFLNTILPQSAFQRNFLNKSELARIPPRVEMALRLPAIFHLFQSPPVGPDTENTWQMK